VDAEELINKTAEKVRAALDSAQERADEIVRDAEAEAQRIRARAEAEARERLDQVREALERLEAGLGGASPPLASKPAAKAPPAETSEPEAPAPAEQPAPPEPEPESAPEASNKTSGDDAGAARLVAMKLALDDTPRDEARKRLAAEYDLPDLDGLLDDVYAKAGR
jgi:hypothetical protein